MICDNETGQCIITPAVDGFSPGPARIEDGSITVHYVGDPMCSWCWGFAPVVQALAEQAAAAGVPLKLVVGGLRRERAAMEPSARVRILSHWQAVNASTGQLFNFQDALPESFVYDTEPACRALVTARQLDEQNV